MAGLETLATIVSVAGTAVSAIGQMQASKYQQAVAERNRAIAEDNKRRAIEDSQREAQDWGDSARVQFGDLMADLAASGVATQGGTASLLRTGTRELIQRDNERIRAAGDNRARAFGQQSADFQAQANMAGSQAGFSLFGGLLNATSTYISSATQKKKNNALLAKVR